MLPCGQNGKKVQNRRETGTVTELHDAKTKAALQGKGTIGIKGNAKIAAEALDFFLRSGSNLLPFMYDAGNGD
jgi:hypothetical protein